MYCTNQMHSGVHIWVLYANLPHGAAPVHHHQRAQAAKSMARQLLLVLDLTACDLWWWCTGGEPCGSVTYNTHMWTPECIWLVQYIGCVDQDRARTEQLKKNFYSKITCLPSGHTGTVQHSPVTLCSPLHELVTWHRAICRGFPPRTKARQSHTRLPLSTLRANPIKHHLWKLTFPFML
jgi:hypothetical protein